jgi:hypothetical protein
VRLEGLGQLEKAMTSSGIESATFRLQQNTDRTAMNGKHLGLYLSVI